MAIQTFPGMSTVLLPGMTKASGGGLLVGVSSSTDATGEAVHYVGQIWIDGGSSKTISAAGSGKIHWRAGSTTVFASASTLRVGLQDVSETTGPACRGDGTFNVSADLEGGTDTIAASSWQTTTMETGTKTLAHGDMVAIVFNLVTRAGSDSIAFVAVSTAGNARACYTLEAPAGTFAQQANLPNAVIEFDDGTLGFLRGSFVITTGPGVTTFGNASTPDELCAIINLPAPQQVDGFWGVIGTTTSSGNYDLILYSDALGSPAVERTVSVDANQRGTGNTRYGEYPFATFTMLADIYYAVALRPTTSNSVILEEFTVSDAAHMKAHPLGTSCYKGTRSDQTGPFTANTLARLSLGVIVCGADDGAGGGGAETFTGGRFNRGFN